MDLDEILAFKTPRVVIIRDRRLGILRIAVSIPILVYFVAKRLVWDKAYLALEPVTGTIDFFVSAPQGQDRKNPTELPYCSEYLGSESALQQYPCTSMSAYDASLGSSRHSIFVVTRFKDLKGFNSSCLRDVVYYAGESNCRIDTYESPAHFNANVEDYRITMSHVVSAVSTPTDTFSNNQMTSAELHCMDGKAIAVVSRLSDNVEYDELPIRDLLLCAGIRLDDVSLDGRPFRRLGLTLFLDIHYEHDSWGSVFSYSYVVTPMFIKSREYITDSEHAHTMLNHPPTVTKSPLSHTAWELRYGIRVMVRQYGMQGSFSFSQLVLSWVEALALLGITNWIVITAMTYLLPSRKTYREMIYQKTVDFSSLEDGDPDAVAAVKSTVTHNRTLSGAHLSAEEKGRVVPVSALEAQDVRGDRGDNMAVGDRLAQIREMIAAVEAENGQLREMIDSPRYRRRTASSGK